MSGWGKCDRDNDECEDELYAEKEEVGFPGSEGGEGIFNPLEIVHNLL